jgi:putative sterol carrier protein
MSDPSLLGAARRFVARYQANAALCRDQAGWDCTIRLQASDAPEQVFLAVADGHVRELSERRAPCALTVTAARQVLMDILELRLNPNQPYVFGELTVTGEEADFMRVDYIATLLCVP